MSTEKGSSRGRQRGRGTESRGGVGGDVDSGPEAEATEWRKIGVSRRRSSSLPRGQVVDVEHDG